MSITCTCVALPAAACAYPKTCAFFNRLDGYEFTDCSSVVDGREKRSLRSVGALIFPDADWATAFHIGNNWILTAGHVFADPIPDEAWPCADAKSADSYIVMFDHEAGMDPIARTKCVLDPLHATALDVKFHRVRDNHLDYSLCKVLSTTELNHTHPAPELAKNLPVADDKVYLIHHAIQGRAKQLIAGKCRFVDGQRIYVDFQADLGASGGLLLNEKWEAIGVMVDGQSTFPFAYSLLTILRDIGAPMASHFSCKSNPPEAPRSA